MNRKLLIAALLASIAVAACKPQAPAEPAATTEPPAATAAEPMPATAAPAETAADAPFDVKGFAGTFSGTLPCADCPGIDTKITLAADGTYTLHESYRDKPGNGFDGDGTWTAEENGKRIRLDPNSKSEQDRLFSVKSKDEIESLDAQGQPIPGTAPHSLKRAMMMEGAGI